jgi:hypothetical protein
LRFGMHTCRALPRHAFRGMHLYHPSENRRQFRVTQQISELLSLSMVHSCGECTRTALAIACLTALFEWSA